MIDDDAGEIYNLENSLRSICGTTFVYADIDAAKAFLQKIYKNTNTNTNAAVYVANFLFTFLANKDEEKEKEKVEEKVLAVVES